MTAAPAGEHIFATFAPGIGVKARRAAQQAKMRLGLLTLFDKFVGFGVRTPYVGLGLGLGLGLEGVFVFDSKSEKRDRALEGVVLGVGEQG